MTIKEKAKLVKQAGKLYELAVEKRIEATEVGGEKNPL
jgi:hypothetical protein